MEQAVVSHVAVCRDAAGISVLGVPGQTGMAGRILDALADAQIAVDVIVQNVGKEGRIDIRFTVRRNDCARTLDLLTEKVVPALGAQEVTSDTDVCKVSLVGTGLRGHVGVASRMFCVLREEGVTVQMISTSETRISVVIDGKSADLAVHALRKAFALDLPGPRLPEPPRKWGIIAGLET